VHRTRSCCATLTIHVFTLRPIGHVSSSLRDPTLAPKQGHEGAPAAWLENPVGIHRVKILEVASPTHFQVDAIEAIDQTPIIDVTPVLDRRLER